jgi:hypothetical protein
LNVWLAHFRVLENSGDSGEIESGEVKEEVEVKMAWEGIYHEEAD